MSKFVKTEYSLSGKRFARKLCFAVVSDLHSNEHTQIETIVDKIKSEKVDFILMPGDIFERLDGSKPLAKKAGFELMSACAKIAPVFYSIGNHENGGIGSWNAIKWSKIKSIPFVYDGKDLDKIFERGVTLLDNEYVIEDGIAFGGLSSGMINEKRHPDTQWLDEFCMLDCPKILLCHHPEYYKKYLRNRDIDLIVSGHAHGGQWRVFGRGVFAPGQGIFPKYTSGIYDGKLVVSRGLKPSGHIPRIFNNPEVVFVKTE